MTSRLTIASALVLLIGGLLAASIAGWLAFALALLILGAAGAFVAGLVGVGGAIVMIPLLLYVLPWFGTGTLDVKAVAGVTMVQVFFGAVSGMRTHGETGAVNAPLVWTGGVCMAAGSLVGALGSSFVSGTSLLGTFAAMVTIAMAVGVASLVRSEDENPALSAQDVRFDRVRAGVVSGGVGVAAGLVGAGGAFLLTPLLLVVVGVPTRVTIGSSLGITAVASVAGVLGKAMTRQIPWGAAMVVGPAAVLGAHFGARVSKHCSTLALKLTLLVINVVIAGYVWWDLLGRLRRR